MTAVPAPGRQVGAPFEHGVLTEAGTHPATLTGDGLTDLMQAILAVAGELELPSVLERFVQVSAELTGARFGAINVLDNRGASTTFVYTGVPTAIARMLSHPPHAQGVLGQIPDQGALRLTDLTKHPAFRGWPDNHPPMGSFLGAAVLEIGGAWLVWQGVREHRGWPWVVAGVASLGVYGFFATLQPAGSFGRILAAYGGCSSQDPWSGRWWPTATGRTGGTSSVRSCAWPGSD